MYSSVPLNIPELESVPLLHIHIDLPTLGPVALTLRCTRMTPIALLLVHGPRKTAFG